MGCCLMGCLLDGGIEIAMQPATTKEYIRAAV